MLICRGFVYIQNDSSSRSKILIIVSDIMSNMTMISSRFLTGRAPPYNIDRFIYRTSKAVNNESMGRQRDNIIRVINSNRDTFYSETCIRSISIIYRVIIHNEYMDYYKH